MRHDTTKALFEYWNSIRNDRPAPERSEIEPSDVRRILGDTFILEISTQMRAISYRLAGTRLCAAHGRELKGNGYLTLWREEDNYEIVKAVHSTYHDFRPVIISYTAESQSGRFVEYESILLPLMPAADGNARILGAAAPRRAPYWVGADPLIINHLRKVRMMNAQHAAPTLAPAPNAGPTPPNGDSRRRMKGHLVVIDGGLTNNDAE